MFHDLDVMRLRELFSTKSMSQINRSELLYKNKLLIKFPDPDCTILIFGRE